MNAMIALLIEDRADLHAELLAAVGTEEFAGLAAMLAEVNARLAELGY